MCYALIQRASGSIPQPSCVRATASTEGGFSLIELIAGITLLAVAILTHASTTVGEHRLSVEERIRSEALHVTQQVIQRLRSDEDWATLYERLRLRLDQTVNTSAGTTVLADGRRAYVPQTYFPDFSLAAPMRECHLLIEVPAAALAEDPAGPTRLREDLEDPRFGLPADLNGDGAMDGMAHDDDYAVLPVRVIVQWIPPGEATRVIEVVAWLRGDR